MSTKHELKNSSTKPNPTFIFLCTTFGGVSGFLLGTSWPVVAVLGSVAITSTKKSKILISIIHNLGSKSDNMITVATTIVK
jgi:hypothetical protein